MQTSFFKLLPVIILSVGVLLGTAIVVHAQLENVIYPIAELGNCENESACHAYCDDAAHINECVDFAERHNLMSREEIQHARAFINAGQQGPGGCTGHDACEAYCSTADHIIECVAFAEQHGIMSERDLEDARRVRDHIQAGGSLPIGCTDVITCKQRCDDPSAFTDDEAEALAILRSCFDFARDAGLMPADVDQEQAEAAFRLLEEGVITSFDELDRCDDHSLIETDPAAFEKCIEVGLLMGVVSQEEADFIRRTGGVGPGGCRGSECEDFCENPANQETCFEFAREHDLLRPEDKERLEEGLDQIREVVNTAPPEVLACVRGGGIDLDRILSGDDFPTPALGDHIQRCFEDHFSSQFQGEFDLEGGFPGGEPGTPIGPGGNINFPPEVQTCLSQKFGDDFLNNLLSPTGPPSPDTEAKIGQCFGEAFGVPDDGPPHDDGSDPSIIGPDNFDVDHLDGILPEGVIPQEIPDGFEDQFQQQFQDQFDQQFQDQFDQQFQQQFQQQFDAQQQQIFDQQGFDPSQGFPAGFDPSQIPDGFDPNQPLPNPDDFGPGASRISSPPSLLGFFLTILGLR